jgi:uncharacterized protein YbjT (DUF2867 family)
MTDVALSPPVNGVVEIAGPEPIRMSDLIARFMKAMNDPRKVTADPHARYHRASVQRASKTGSATSHSSGADPRAGRRRASLKLKAK